MKHVLGVVLYVAFFGALLFVSARTIDWPRAWVLLGLLFFIRAIGTARVLRVNRELLAERSGLPVHRGQATLDKLLLPAFMLSFGTLVSFDGLDGFRLHVLGKPHWAIATMGLALFALGWSLVMEALRTNAFASRVVRYQPDRGQRVVESGLYQYVRHPMYAGLVAAMVGMGLWLGSYAGAVAAILPAGILVLRIRVEEGMLRRHLPTYADYAMRVRRRLIPGVW